MLRRLAPALAATLALAAPLHATEAAVIGWEDLAPSVPELENPFEAMDYDTLDQLRRVLQLRLQIQAGATGYDDELAAGEARLAEAGHDVDALLEHRQRMIARNRIAATTVNQELIDETVRLPGYLLPLDMTGGETSRFLLVPTIGACVHVPPPPPNQVVVVTYPEGFPVDGLFTPVWIEGVLGAEASMQDVDFADGGSRVEVSYAMTAASVTPYR